MFRHILHHVLPAACLLLPCAARAAFVNFEGKQTRPIVLSADGTRLLAVNTPDARLSVFDVSVPANPVLIAEIPVGMEPGSVNLRAAGEAWVVNELSDSVSIVSLPRGAVIDTLRVGDEPADVVFAGGRAFVSAARANRIDVFDATNRASLGSIPLQGENPRALAVSTNGATVYAAFALSGNRTTLIPLDQAPPQPPPNVITNDPPQVGLVVDATDTNWTPVIQYTMPDHDVAAIDVAGLAVTQYVDRVGTVNLGLAVRPANGDLYVANTDARNLVRFEPNLRGHAVDNRVSRIALPGGAVTAFDLNPGVDYSVLPNPAALATALAQPTALVFDPVNDVLYAAAFGTDRIARLDPGGTILARIEVGPVPGAAADPANMRGPRGLAINAGAQVLYVLNRIANTIMVIDLLTDTVVRELPAGSHDPTPAVIRAGRGFLYDARLSGNGTFACAACHVDAEMDMIAWDLGDPDGSMQTVTNELLGIPTTFDMHPMKGPMVTQTLRGLKDLEPLHWRGDRDTFLTFNPTFSNLMGGPQLSPADMQAFRAYIETIGFHPNPHQELDRTLPADFEGGDAAAGRTTYLTEPYIDVIRCNDCHVVNPGPGSNGTIIPARALLNDQPFKVPHLRNLYKKRAFDNTPGAQSVGGFGFVHDGVFSTLEEFLSLSVFPNFATNTVKKKNLVAFMMSLDTGTAPAVGHDVTLDASNKAGSNVVATCTLLESQAAASNINLVAKGILGSAHVSLLFDPGTGLYATDTTGVGPYTRTQLLAQVTGDAVLTAMGVPPGAGARMAHDRDEDGVADGDATGPALDVATGGAVVTWPGDDSWYVLEETADLGVGTWSTVTEERFIEGGQVVVTNNAPAGAGSYRLRRPW